MRAFLLALLLLTTLAVAGCSSKSGEKPATDLPTGSAGKREPDAASPSTSPSSTAGATADRPASPPPSAAASTWSMKAYDGDVLVAPSANLDGAAHGIDTFTVPKDAKQAWFNLTVSAQPTSEVKARFLPPSGCTSTTDCHDIHTTGGVASQRIDAPEAGDWQIAFFGDPAPASGTYHFEVNALVPA